MKLPSVEHRQLQMLNIKSFWPICGRENYARRISICSASNIWIPWMQNGKQSGTISYLFVLRGVGSITFTHVNLCPGKARSHFQDVSTRCYTMFCKDELCNTSRGWVKMIILHGMGSVRSAVGDATMRRLKMYIGGQIAMVSVHGIRLDAPRLSLGAE